MTTFYLNSDKIKDIYFEIDRSKDYTVNIPMGICQKFYYPVSEIFDNILSKNKTTGNNITSYFIGVDWSFELNKTKILELQNDLGIIINNYDKILSEIDVEEIHYADRFNVPELIETGWKYSSIYYDKEKTKELLFCLTKDIIEIGNRAILNNEDLCGITL